MITTQAGRAEIVCPYCGVGCRLAVKFQQDRILEVRGIQDAAANRGRICPRGASLPRNQLGRDRIHTPLLREDRKKPFQQVTWSEAEAFVADRLTSLIAEHGPDCFGFYGASQLHTETAYAACKFVKGGLLTNNTETDSRPSMASAAAGYRSSLGSDGSPACYEDISQADVILVLGSSMAEAHPVTFDFIRAKKRIHPSTFIIVVDPRRTRTSEIADIHVPIIPSSEVVFLNAIAFFLVNRGLTDHRFIQEHTAGIETLKTYLDTVDPRELGALCGVEPGALLTIADHIGCAQRFLSYYVIDATSRGSDAHKNNCLINLHLLTGQIGKPGAGPFSPVERANTMGVREAGLPGGALPGHRRVEQDEDRHEMERLWGLPHGALRPRPGLEAVDMFCSLAANMMKAIWVCGANPLVSLSDVSAARHGLRAADLVVVQGSSVDREMAERAHVILPSAGWPEKEGTSTNSERMVTFSERVLEPPGDARHDWQIISGVAARMGLPGFDWQDTASVWEEYRSHTAGRSCDQSGMTAARLRRVRSLQWPCPTETHPGTERLYTDYSFATPDGKAQIHTWPHRDPSERVDDQFPLLLTNRRPNSTSNSAGSPPHAAGLIRHESDPFIEISSEDARLRKIENGAKVEVESRRGILAAYARLSPLAPPGVVFIGVSSRDLFRSRTPGGQLETAVLEPISGPREFKPCAVQVRLQPSSASTSSAARNPDVIAPSK